MIKTKIQVIKDFFFFILTNKLGDWLKSNGLLIGFKSFLQRKFQIF